MATRPAKFLSNIMHCKSKLYTFLLVRNVKTKPEGLINTIVWLSWGAGSAERSRPRSTGVGLGTNNQTYQIKQSLYSFLYELITATRRIYCISWFIQLSIAMHLINIASYDQSFVFCTSV